MCSKDRLNQIPVLYFRGDNFTLGFTIGRQFKSLIEDHLSRSDYFQQSLLPGYETEEGKALFQKQLDLCTKKFPQYLKEIEGMAEGSGIPFYKLFLLNLDVFTSSQTDFFQRKGKEGCGCTSLLSNGKEKFLGHTEDTGFELNNNVFILSAEILNESGEKVGKFSTLTYAGCLPGYTMGYNEHGFIHSVNTLYPLNPPNDKSPRGFIARSLLGARSLEDAVKIVRDEGNGIADGFSLNACFTKQEKMYNIEVCPDARANVSIVDVLEIKAGETYDHCNMFRRIKTKELPLASIFSECRHKVIENKFPEPERLEILRNMLSDQSGPDYPIYMTGEKFAVTVAVGIFDIVNLKWNIYTEPPNSSSPVAVLPLDFN